MGRVGAARLRRQLCFCRQARRAGRAARFPPRRHRALTEEDADEQPLARQQPLELFSEQKSSCEVSEEEAEAVSPGVAASRSQ
jgi:hypothetical protein